MKEVELTYRVPYADTDQMGVVYYANYLVFFERSRNELMRSLGLTYKEMEDRGLGLPVLEAHCVYHAPARYDDLLTIRARVDGFEGIKLRVKCEVRRGETLLVEGYTLHVCLDYKQLRPVRPPEWFTDLLN